MNDVPEGATAEDFAYHIHSDIGDGLLHAKDCRAKRQIAASHELDPPGCRRNRLDELTPLAAPQRSDGFSTL
jgi:hypothetical protein